MKLHKIALAGALAGSLGFVPTLARANDMHRYDSRKSVGDDGALTPFVPGVTADPNDSSQMSKQDAKQMEQTLANDGYNPGAIDGVIDDQTQAAISEFQADHDLAVTGIVDAETGELLGIIVSQWS